MINGVDAVSKTSSIAEESKAHNRGRKIGSNSSDFINGTTGVSREYAEGAANTEVKAGEEEEGLQPSGTASKKQVEDAVKDANSKLKMTNTRCEFEYHEKSKRVSIKVVDRDTDKVVKEIPPEESIEMVEKLWELAGLFLDEKR